MTNGADASVSRIGLADGSVQRIPVGNAPGGIVTGFGSVWLTAGTKAIWRLNPGSRQVEKIIDIGGAPFGLTAGPDAVRVTLPDTGTVLRIDRRTNMVVKRIRLGFKTHTIAVGPDAVWVSVAKRSPDPTLRAQAAERSRSEKARSTSSESGPSASTSSSASARARSSSGRSLRRCAKWRSVKPDWRVPSS